MCQYLGTSILYDAEIWYNLSQLNSSVIIDDVIILKTMKT